MTKLMPLLASPQTRFVALQALSNVTHHGGSDIRREIATYTPHLLRLMEEFPDNSAIHEHIIVTLAHAISSVVHDQDNSASVKAANIRKLNMPKVFDVVFRCLKKPDTSYNMLSHALDFLSGTAIACHDEVMANSSVLNLLVALLRSNNLSIRVGALNGLSHLVVPDSEPDNRFRDPRTMISALSRSFPPHLVDILTAYGPEKTDTFISVLTTGDFQNAMMNCVQTYDLCTLGLKLAELIQRTEFSIAEGGFQVENPRTGRVEFDSCGLPFTMWGDGLPHCAKALRERNRPGDLDAADIVECKFFVMRSRVPDAVRLAQQAIERSPQIAYYYYIVGLGTDQPLGLRASKKGLKCRKITPFVKHYLLWRAIDHAGQLGISKIQSSRPGDMMWSEGVAFLKSALDDAKTFIAEAPPDSSHMRTILNWYIILFVTMHGPEITPDLRQLKVNQMFLYSVIQLMAPNLYQITLQKLKITREFQQHFNIPEKKTQLRLIQELIVNRYERGYNEWKDFIAHLDSLHSTEEEQEQSAIDAEDNLAAWLEGTNLDDHERENRGCGGHARTDASNAELGHCSFCHNPSAVLRKCAGCGKAR